jgi:hypothetical protein
VSPSTSNSYLLTSGVPNAGVVPLFHLNVIANVTTPSTPPGFVTTLTAPPCTACDVTPPSPTTCTTAVTISNSLSKFAACITNPLSSCLFA